MLLNRPNVNVETEPPVKVTVFVDLTGVVVPNGVALTVIVAVPVLPIPHREAFACVPVHVNVHEASEPAVFVAGVPVSQVVPIESITP